jgi:hypothetical protein
MLATHQHSLDNSAQGGAQRNADQYYDTDPQNKNGLTQDQAEEKIRQMMPPPPAKPEKKEPQ